MLTSRFPGLPRPAVRRALPCLALALLLTSTGCQTIQNALGRGSSPTPSTPPSSGTLSPSPNASPTPLGVWDKTVYEPLSPRCQNARAMVLMYHDIPAKRGKGSVWFDCTKAELTEQLDWLAAQGANFISLEELHHHLVRGEPLPSHAVALTFDDNYQGFYDNAYPLLKSRSIPSAMFVHTNFVGDKKGTHPKMDWDTLRKLDKDGLCTIASHTLSHPTDMAKLSLEDQQRELTESKATLERELGHPIPYFAYPNGTGDKVTFDAAQQAGYTLAFTIENGPAEESPSVLRVQRYIHTRYKKAWQDCNQAWSNAPAAVVDLPLKQSPISLTVAAYEGVKLGLVRGGLPSTWRSPNGRSSVGEFVDQAQKSGILDAPAVGGMNGTFFADAWLKSRDSTLIGPSLCRSDAAFYPETDAYRLTRLKNRPLVLWGPSQLLIVPFNPDAMNDEATLKAALPDVTDIFLAGAWIVHDGVARTKEQMSAYSARDFNDPRRRAFFGVTATGEPVLGGTLDVVTTEAMAKAAAAAGVQEAVLMDSGFSTSIVFNDKIIVTGHTAKDLPSRPVPHGIVVYGQTVPPEDPDTQAVFEKADPSVGAISAVDAQEQLSQDAATGSGNNTGKRRRRRRQR